jgi:hypothetical protein
MSLSKSESARINGAKSRGPKSPAGKAASSQNAIKHGLFAKVILLRNESAQAFDEMTEDFVRRFEPRDDLEFTIVEQMVAATWRLSRCWSMQAQIMNLEMDKGEDADDEALAARSFLASIGNSSAMQILHRFENSYERMITRAIRNLTNLRKNFPLPDDDTQKRENEPKPPSNDATAQPPTAPQKRQNEPETNQSPDRPITQSPIPAFTNFRHLGCQASRLSKTPPFATLTDWVKRFPT